MNSASLLATLRLPFCSLERFSINISRNYGGDPKPWNWNSFSSELKDALSNIVHSSNLKTLSLNGVTKIPITFFLNVVHLTTLELNFVSPMDFCYEISSSPTSAASEGVAPTASHLLIDRCIWELDGLEYTSERKNCPTISMFLPFMCRPRLLDISVGLGPGTGYDFDILSFLMGSLCTSLASPATLQRLKFYISLSQSVDNEDTDSFYEDLLDYNVWSRLDAIASHPFGSLLQQVDIYVDYSFAIHNDWDPDGNEVSIAVLDGLPLLRKKDILFVRGFSEFTYAEYGPGIRSGLGCY